MREGQPFIGAEALACGALNRHQLRTRYRAIYPGIYLDGRTTPSLRQRIVGAWLWSRRGATVAGSAAAAIHGVRWIDEDSPVELIWRNSRSPRGIITRDDRLLAGEWVNLSRMPVTSPERTAFDIGRRGTLGLAVGRLDALSRATGLKVRDVVEVAERHPGSRGLRRLETALPLVDAGAQSPKETWLRLLLVNAGLPTPETQIPVLAADGYPFAYLDMGWPERMVGVEYDGDHHRVDRRQYVKDIRRYAKLEAMGWHVVRVVAEDPPADILQRVRSALALSG